MALLGTAPRWRAVETTHGGLHRDARSFVEGPEYDGRQGAVDLFVDASHRQGPSAPATVRRRAHVIERPSVRAEPHLQLRRSAERTPQQNLVAAGHVGV